MPNIRVDTSYTIKDGSEVVFTAPCNCNEADGLKVYYPEGSKEFAFTDAHGNILTGIGELFAEGALVKAILDVTRGFAYVQNADTNSYLEGRFAEMAVDKGSYEGNLNVLFTPGVYFINLDKCTNGPDLGMDGFLTVKKTTSYPGESWSTVYIHNFITTDGNREATRVKYHSNAWTAWRSSTGVDCPILEGTEKMVGYDGVAATAPKGTWRYRMWANGDVECWGQGSAENSDGCSTNCLPILMTEAVATATLNAPPIATTNLKVKARFAVCEPIRVGRDIAFTSQHALKLMRYEGGAGYVRLRPATAIKGANENYHLSFKLYLVPGQAVTVRLGSNVNDASTNAAFQIWPNGNFKVMSNGKYSVAQGLPAQWLENQWLSASVYTDVAAGTYTVAIDPMTDEMPILATGTLNTANDVSVVQFYPDLTATGNGTVCAYIDDVYMERRTATGSQTIVNQRFENPDIFIPELRAFEFIGTLGEKWDFKQTPDGHGSIIVDTYRYQAVNLYGFNHDGESLDDFSFNIRVDGRWK